MNPTGGFGFFSYKRNLAIKSKELSRFQSDFQAPISLHSDVDL